MMYKITLADDSTLENLREQVKVLVGKSEDIIIKN